MRANTGLVHRPNVPVRGAQSSLRDGVGEVIEGAPSSDTPVSDNPATEAFSSASGTAGYPAVRLLLSPTCAGSRKRLALGDPFDRVRPRCVPYRALEMSLDVTPNAGTRRAAQRNSENSEVSQLSASVRALGGGYRQGDPRVIGALDCRQHNTLRLRTGHLAGDRS